jgi:hypothetical protein
LLNDILLVKNENLFLINLIYLTITYKYMPSLIFILIIVICDHFDFIFRNRFDQISTQFSSLKKKN